MEDILVKEKVKEDDDLIKKTKTREKRIKYFLVCLFYSRRLSFYSSLRRRESGRGKKTTRPKEAHKRRREENAPLVFC